MKAPNPKLQIPDRAIASIVFGCLSIYTLRVYADLMWGPTPDGHLSDQALGAIGTTCARLEAARRVLAILALVWCLWSWCKEWWVPATVATLFTLLALYMAFIVDT